jgi:TonB-dependent receptor
VKKHIIVTLLGFALFLPFQLKAQSTGTITGTVVDAETGETIIGANVVIEGTTTGASTDIDGKYTIRGIEEGTYTFVFSYISYQKQTVTDVEITAGEVLTLDIALQPQTAELDDVVVTADAILDNEAGLLRQRQKSVSFNDAISAESISSSGAGDAAEAMKKVVGASVVGGKYVFIRGLGDRYTGTQLNGSNLPSADPDRKSFQMDLFPSNMIENITTSKTFTPDKPGNFSGGLVDITTKDFHDGFSFNLSYSSEINTQSSFDNVLLGNRSNTDFLGFDNGKREIPGPLKEILNNPGQEIPDVIDARNNPELAQTLDNISRSFNNNMEATEEYVPLNQSFSVSVGNLHQLFGRDFGYNASISYSQSFNSYFNGIQARYELSGNDPNAVDGLTPELNLSDTRGEQSVDVGGLLNLSYKLSDNHRLSTTLIRTQSGSNVGRYLAGSNPEQIGSATPIFQSRAIKYVERDLTSVQLKGKSYFPDVLKATVEWGGSLSQNNQEEPDARFFQSELRYREFPNGMVDTTYQVNASGGRIPPIRFFRDLEENGENANLDISIPFRTHTSQNGKFKFGGSINNTSRTFREYRFEYQLANSDVIRFGDVQGNTQDFFNTVGIVDRAENGDFIFGHTISNNTEIRNNYDAESNIMAAYGMVEMPIFNRLKFVGGLRLEDTYMETVSQDPDSPVGKLDNLDVLPSANLIYNITDEMNFRSAYTRTLARPTFRELAPYISFNFIGDFLFQGSAELERTLVTNYDARWEWFISPGEVLSVSGFYKDFENPLERAIDISLGNNVVSIQNVDQATVYGLEFELRKRLGFIAPALNSFMISTNLALIESEVDIPRIELFERLGITDDMPMDEQNAIIADAPDRLKTRELSGQSPYTYNFDLSYFNPEIGLNVAANYNKFGDRLETVRRGLNPNIYERSYSTLNFVMSKSISNNFTVKFSADNLLNPDIKTSQELGGNEFVNSSNKIGRSFKLGISYGI